MTDSSVHQATQSAPQSGPVVRDLPDPPTNLWRIVGPGVVAAGVGISSGEFILWPYIASQVGLVFLWAAILGMTTQFFLNMEIERYTLATAQTAVAGFNRFWKHWGLVFAILVYFANLWPGWVMSSATLATYVFGGNPRLIAVCALVVIGIALTLAPVVYVALERLIFVKIGAVVALITLAVVLVINAESWRALPAGLTKGASSPSSWGSRCSWARWRLRAPAVDRISARAIGSATRDSGWDIRATAGEPGHGHRGGGAERDQLHVRTEPCEHGAVAALVALRQHRTGSHVRPDDHDHDLPDIDAGALDALR